MFATKNRAIQVQLIRGRYIIEECNAEILLPIFLQLGHPATKHDFETALHKAIESFHDFTNSYPDENDN